MFVGLERDAVNPVERLRHLLRTTPGQRHIIVVEGVLAPVRDIVADVRARGQLLFPSGIADLERVELYRLPDGWGSSIVDPPPR